MRHGSNHILLFCAVAILAALSLPGFSAQEYNLAYNWTVGEKHNFSVYVLGQVVQTGEPAPREIQEKYEESWDVTGRFEPKGLYKLVSTARGSSIYDLESFGIFPDKLKVTRLVDEYGRVDNVEGRPVGSRFYQMPLVLPQIPMAPGRKWKITHPFEVEAFGRKARTDVVAIYTFEEVVANYKKRPHNFARIRVDANYEATAPDGEATVTGQYQGRIFFDLVDRKFVDAQITETRTEKMNADDRRRKTSIQRTYIRKP